MSIQDVESRIQRIESRMQAIGSRFRTLESRFEPAGSRKEVPTPPAESDFETLLQEKLSPEIPDNGKPILIPPRRKIEDLFRPTIQPGNPETSTPAVSIMPIREVEQKTEARRLTANEVTSLVETAARRYRLDPELLRAVIDVESDFRPEVVSNRGAQGLMQLMPDTAEEMGVSDPFNPDQNVDGGARYLRKMLDRFGDVETALAAYNAGPGTVDRHGDIPPYRETLTYVRDVLRAYAKERDGENNSDE